MSRNLQSCRVSQRTAKAAVEGMRAPAVMATERMVTERIVAKRQIVCHIPAGGNDPMEVPDL